MGRERNTACRGTQVTLAEREFYGGKKMQLQPEKDRCRAQPSSPGARRASGDWSACGGDAGGPGGDWHSSRPSPPPTS